VRVDPSLVLQHVHCTILTASSSAALAGRPAAMKTDAPHRYPRRRTTKLPDQQSFIFWSGHPVRTFIDQEKPRSAQGKS
jgi:hypothetical protein